MYDLIKEAIVDDDAAIELSKMDKNVVEVVDAISELSLDKLVTPMFSPLILLFSLFP